MATIDGMRPQLALAGLLLLPAAAHGAPSATYAPLGVAGTPVDVSPSGAFVALWQGASAPFRITIVRRDGSGARTLDAAFASRLQVSAIDLADDGSVVLERPPTTSWYGAASTRGVGYRFERFGGRIAGSSKAVGTNDRGRTVVIAAPGARPLAVIRSPRVDRLGEAVSWAVAADGSHVAVTARQSTNGPADIRAVTFVATRTGARVVAPLPRPMLGVNFSGNLNRAVGVARSGRAALVLQRAGLRFRLIARHTSRSRIHASHISRNGRYIATVRGAERRWFVGPFAASQATKPAWRTFRTGLNDVTISDDGARISAVEVHRSEPAETVRSLDTAGTAGFAKWCEAGALPDPIAANGHAAACTAASNLELATAGGSLSLVAPGYDATATGVVSSDASTAYFVATPTGGGDPVVIVASITR